MTDTITLRETAVAALAAYDRANPMRTADWHGEDCDCFRCEMDRLRALLDARTEQPAPDAVADAEPAGVAAATEIIQWQGKEVTACAMIQHIADTLKEKGKGLITTDPASFGRVILEFDAALTALGEKAKP